MIQPPLYQEYQDDLNKKKEAIPPGNVALIRMTEVLARRNTAIEIKEQAVQLIQNSQENKPKEFHRNAHIARALLDCSKVQYKRALELLPALNGLDPQNELSAILGAGIRQLATEMLTIQRDIETYQEYLDAYFKAVK